MKKSGVGIFVSALIILVSAAYASETKTTMDHSTHTGKKIHEANVQGYRLAYHLLELPGNNLQHLMVYIIDQKGDAVAKGKVGYLIEGPDGSKQKVMAASMKEAFGGNVNFQISGTYTIKTKAVFEDKKLLDQFVFEVK